MPPEDKATLIAVRGRRNGYLQLAPGTETLSYGEMPDELLLATKAWAAFLESQGAKRVYWITLSEMVRHLHIHLYPRWMDEEERGLPLFEKREQSLQPPWTENIEHGLEQWCLKHGVRIASSLAPESLAER